MNRLVISALLVASITAAAQGQAISAKKISPNLESNMDAPLRYHPDGTDFVIENGAEFFNRPLYGGNTAFRVDTGDKPEFVLYGLPGRGGNLRLGIRDASGSKWLHMSQSITARYRPGGMIYDIKDPMLGAQGVLHIEAYALASTEGLIVRVEGKGTPAGVEWLWAYGGANGKRGARDGDIGTENVPISEYFQLAPAMCQGNAFEPAAGSFSMKFNAGTTPVTIFGRTPGDANPQVADAQQWNNPGALLASVNGNPALPVIVGHVPLVAEPRFLSLQHLGTAAVPGDLQVVTGDQPEAAPATKNLAAFSADELPKVFADAETHFKTLRERVAIDTPDPYINAAAAALNIAADAVWDDSQHAIMHGAVAWRQKLLGWRGPYSLDDLGWHDRADQNFATWAPKLNTKPIPLSIPAAAEKDNLSRNENGLHTNGDMSNSHYDMNMVHIDAAFRHILWTGDVAFAKREWPIIQASLAWEQRSFRRTYGPDKLPLYEAYAAIWASDDLEYDGGGAAHASAYNYYHNTMAARVASLVGADPAPYHKEADLIAKAMRQYLWIPEKGEFAEFRDYLGMQLPHESAALWTFYHTVDSEVPTPMEAWQMATAILQNPHVPVKGPGVPNDQPYALLPTTTWMPYLWSLNNVNMNENAHAALALFQANRIDDGTRLLKSGILASMYMGISPGNVGTMTYLDVYRRESQRDFGDASGTLSRAMVEGLFGIHPDAIAHELRITPGFPDSWDHASIRHPDISYSFKRTGQTDDITIESRFPTAMALRLEWPAHLDDVASVTINGQPAKWSQRENDVGTPHILVTAPVAAKWELAIVWRGSPLTTAPVKMKLTDRFPVDPPRAILTTVDATGKATVVTTAPGNNIFFLPSKQGAFLWQRPIEFDAAAKSQPSAPPFDWSKDATPPDTFETVDLSKFFNDNVTQIFKHEYRTPRSPGVSLAIPKQGIGAWAGDINATATIDDRGLRAEAARDNGKIIMPNGAPFATPSAPNTNNILFTSQFDNFPKEAKIPLTGKARRILLLMAGSTNPMQSRFDNGEVIVTYTDGTTAKLLLNNPVNWWPIEQDYFIDDYQFRRPEAIPPRINLATGQIRLLNVDTFKGQGGKINGGAATALDLALDPAKELQSLTVHTLANEVVIGLMSATLVR